MKAKSPQMGLSQPLLLYTEAQKSNFHKRKSSFLQWELLDDFFLGFGVCSDDRKRNLFL